MLRCVIHVQNIPYKFDSLFSTLGSSAGKSINAIAKIAGEERRVVSEPTAQYDILVNSLAPLRFKTDVGLLSSENRLNDTEVKMANEV
jgi:hypothetical protein